MISHFELYLTFENIYLWTNYGVIPFWVMLIMIPNHSVTQFFLNSIIIPLILGGAYIYIIYQTALLDISVFGIFKLYLNLDELYTVFSTESFLLIFWLHFVALNIFLGSWMVRDAGKYNMSRSITFLPLILVYFTGPVGIVFYWLIRLFFSKKIKFHD
tara:strand:+ start:798 stop:1271 length:474 start_codon:yes stop_codon:yes gene_type:complete